ncbi:MAG: TraR/DksA C4-type zinc finger protein [Balneolaceae bacterium]
MMNKADRKKIIQRLQEILQDVEQDIRELEELTQPIAPDNAIGRVSRMDAINNKAINDAALIKQKKRRKRLQKALERSESDSFGHCTRCGALIAMGRLEYIPDTTRCVGCV